MPDATDLGFRLLPSDDPAISPEDDLASAAASALAPDFTPVPGEAPVPIGRSWLFDHVLGRFVRRGQDPDAAVGDQALAMWCLNAIYSARFAHAVFGDDFGMERPEDPIGETAVNVGDYVARLRRALTVHDRVTAVSVEGATYDPASGVFDVGIVTVTKDDQTTLSLENVSLRRNA